MMILNFLNLWYFETDFPPSLLIPLTIQCPWLLLEMTLYQRQDAPYHFSSGQQYLKNYIE